MTRRWVTTLALTLLLLVQAASAGPGARAQQPETKKPLSDPPLINIQGYRDLLARCRGKPILVNFWATWCEPCREEYPMINELARHYAPQGLAVIGITLDGDGEITLVRRFLAKNKPIFPNYRKRPGEEESFINAVNPKWSGAIPASFFYARDGRAFAHLIGEHTREEFEKAIRALLDSAPKSATQASPRFPDHK